MLGLGRKSDAVGKFQKSDSDTGSPSVQIALITKRIQDLTEHFKIHKKDFHSMRGLTNLVSQRKKLLSYLRKNDVKKYQEVIKEFNLRK